MPIELDSTFLSKFIAKTYQSQTNNPDWVTLLVHVTDRVGIDELKLLAYKSMQEMCDDENSTFIKQILLNVNVFMSNDSSPTFDEARIFDGNQSQKIKVGRTSTVIRLYFDSPETAQAYAKCMQDKIYEEMRGYADY